MLNSHRHIREEAEFQQFLHNYDHQLFFQISQKIQEREDSKDVLQNVLVHLWEYRHLMNTNSWQQIVFKTCKQKIAEYYRKNKQALLHDHLDENMDTVAFDDPYEKKERLLSALETSISLLMPPIRQTVFRMNKLQGLKQEQIAQNLKISKRTVENHIAKAMKFLKNLHKNS